MGEVKLSEKLKKEKQKTDKLIDEAYKANVDYFADRERHKLRFEGIDLSIKSKKEQWQNTYISPYPAMAIQQKSAFLTESIVSTDEFLKYYPAGNLEKKNDADLYTRLIAYYMRNINLGRLSEKHNKNVLIEGTGIYRVYWAYQKSRHKVKAGKKLVFDEKIGALRQEDAYVEKEFVELDQPMFEPVKNNDIWIDADAESIEKARYVIYRDVVCLSKLKQMQDSGVWGIKHLDKVKESPFPDRSYENIKIDGDSSRSLSNRRAEYDIDSIQRQNLTNRKNDPLVELLYIHTPYEIQLVANGVPITPKQVIYEGIKYPFVETVNLPITGEFWGRSDIDQIQADIKHHEEMVNLIIDNYKRHLEGTMILDSSVTKKEQEQLESPEPRKIVRLGAANPKTAIEFIRPDTFDTTSINFNESFKQQAKQNLAINSMMEGEAPGSGIRTEGSLQMFQQIGATRTSVLMRDLIYTYERIGKMFIKLIKQFADEEIVFAAAGKLGESVEYVLRKDDLSDQVSVKVQLATIAEPERMSKTERQLAMLERAVGLDDMQVVDKYRMMAEIFAESSDWEGALDYFETDISILEAKQNLAVESASKTKSIIPQSPKMQQLASPSQEQFPGQAPPQASDVRGITEGNPEGANQFG